MKILKHLDSCLQYILEKESCFFCGTPRVGKSGLCAFCETRLKREEPGGAGESRCPVCSFPRIAKGACPFCSRLELGLDEFSFLSFFSGLYRETFMRYKKGQSLKLRYFFARRLYESFLAKGWQNRTLVPIPPRQGKIKRKGWDQVDLLSQVLEREYNMRVLKVFKRTDRLQQKTLSFAERKEHMEKVIVLSSGRRARELGQSSQGLILLDDVLTSGATMAAGAALLRREYQGPLAGAVVCGVL